MIGDHLKLLIITVYSFGMNTDPLLLFVVFYFKVQPIHPIGLDSQQKPLPALNYRLCVCVTENDSPVQCNVMYYPTSYSAWQLHTFR